jgi:hypothetical protein
MIVLSVVICVYLFQIPKQLIDYAGTWYEGYATNFGVVK